MPSIACRSRIQAVSDHCSLSLGVRHHLVAGKPSDLVYSLHKTRFPNDVDVLMASNIVITLSGFSDGVRVSAEEITASALAQHLVDCFETNATELGLNAVSKLCIDEKDGLPKVVLTLSRQLPANPEILPVHAVLVAIDLCYSWQTPDYSQIKPGRASHPFATRMSLPYKTLLSNVIGRFMTWQLVRRYPLIFGPWCQQLDVESSYFPGLAASIMRVIKRSPNTIFRTRCQRLIEVLRRRQLTTLSDASTLLSSCLSSFEDDGLAPFEGGQPDLSDEEILCFALERIYRDGMSRPQFKGLAHAPSADRADDEYLSQDHGLPAEEHTTPIHEDLLWDDCSKDVLAPIRRLSPAVNFCFLDAPSDGEYGIPFDIELDHYDEDLMNEDEHWNDYDLLPLELPYVPEGHYFRPGHRIDQTPDFEGSLHDKNSHTPPVLDFEDDDVGLDSFLDSSRPEHLGFEGRAAESNAFRSYLNGGHITCADDRNSQDTVGQILGLGGRSQAASSIASLCSPPISGLLSISEEVDLRGKQQSILCRHRRQGQLTGPKGNHDDNTSLYVGDPAILRVSHSDPHDDGDELEFNILSDNDSNITAHTKTNFEENFDLVKRGGVSAATGTRPSFPEASNSHHSLTLDVTWPRQPDCDRQLREFQEEFEDSDEGLWRGELVGKTAQAADMDLGEDILSVMDFAFETDAPRALEHSYITPLDVILLEQ